ncbi:MAG: allantoinase AllB [Solirubrobacteraceae bacterium]
MPEFDLVVTGGVVVTRAGASRVDIGIAGGRIAALAGDLAGAAPAIDATGLHVLPGAIDAHVHLNAPGRSDWEGVAHGTAALAVGGTTTALEMPLNASPPTTDRVALQAKLDAWRGVASVDFALWGGVVPGNAGALNDLARGGVIGFKAFMCDSGICDFPAVDDAALRTAMLVAAEHDLVVAIHAEDAAIIAAGQSYLEQRSLSTAADYLASRPAAAELEAVRRALHLAGETGCAIHLVHLSTGRAVALVAQARRQGVDASCETCPHYLAFCEEDVQQIGTAAKCAPPIRDQADRESLWVALSSGEIDMVASDHSPAPAMRKRGDFRTAWGGIAGGQTLLATLLSDGHHRRGLPLVRVADLSASTVSRRFGLSGKGAIDVGADADLALVDLTAEWTVRGADLRSRHATSPFIGRKLRGRIVRTLLRGVTIARNGIVVATGRGRLLHR